MRGQAVVHPAPARRVSAGALALWLLAALLLGGGIGVLVARLRARPSMPAAVSPPALHGQATWAAGAHPAPSIAALVDQSGRPFSLPVLRGRTLAMAFLDSHCTASCPLEGRALAAAERSLAPAQRPVLVIVSVNPLDTPASTRAAMRSWGLAGLAPWHWLRGPPAELARVWSAYRIFVAPPGHGDIIHTEALYLIDRRGDERSAYLYPFLPRFVRGDLARLAASRRS